MVGEPNGWRQLFQLGLSLGGSPAAGFAERLMVPVKNDTLLLGRLSSKPVIVENWFAMS